jgi:hypothetical protein
VTAQPIHLPDFLAHFTEETLVVAKLLGDAQAVQWQPAPVPKPRDDTTERASGGHGDPTATTVADERRLAVRAAVLTAEEDLRQARHALEQSATSLSTAVAKWYGDA